MNVPRQTAVKVPHVRIVNPASRLSSSLVIARSFSFLLRTMWLRRPIAVLGGI
jgi:hypothetical protein